MNKILVCPVLFITCLLVGCSQESDSQDATQNSVQQATPSLSGVAIPVPRKVTAGEGQFQITEAMKVTTGGITLDIADTFIRQMGNDLGIRLEQGDGVSGAVRLTIEPEISGYRLEVDAGGVDITGADEESLFHGLQTLRQLAFAHRNEAGARVPSVIIEDQPRFRWRGFMLDEARHFHGMDAVKRLLDQMALLKMNYFHWGLTNDQGWRIEIKKYPKLTEIGSYRKDTADHNTVGGGFTGEPHQGFYTQAQIKEIVAYAAQRFIMVVPEINVPGHASAAIASYPWLGLQEGTIEVPVTFGVHKHILNVADLRVLGFIRDVFDEVIALFPGQIIHAGGDEVDYTHWKESQAIKDYMEASQLESFADVQLRFTNELSDYIASKGRRMMGWNEILGGNIHEYQADGVEAAGELDKNAVVHFWDGALDIVRDAAERGYEVVNAHHESTYLNYSYELTPLAKILEFSPIPLGLESSHHDKVLGMSCQGWGERFSNERFMHRMIFPRIAACADRAWGQGQQQDHQDFYTMLPVLESVWREQGILQIGYDQE